MKQHTPRQGVRGESKTLAICLTKTDAAKITAAAKTQNKTVSCYLRDIVVEHLKKKRVKKSEDKKIQEWIAMMTSLAARVKLLEDMP